MEDRKEKNGAWVSVPQFGEWEQKGQVPDYSLDFSKIREMKKQNKREVSRASIGNEEEFINPTVSVTTAPTTDDHHSPTTKRGLFSYFNCCIKA
ncbi:elongation factor 1-delta 1-like [Hibiscus syriacus]|uniref:Elongation factor 1-delta 1-like n=1 Tax=Hibiscus syriacus TaxID=106335 RepID=A0A6A3AQE5_HIBSY|nr:elongation factor 1-delta 1-like [Hibiscus syriacus]